jgi:hypothetical protein
MTLAERLTYLLIPFFTILPLILFWLAGFEFERGWALAVTVAISAGAFLFSLALRAGVEEVMRQDTNKVIMVIEIRKGTEA